jgi:hypothetical protein
VVGLTDPLGCLTPLGASGGARDPRSGKCLPRRELNSRTTDTGSSAGDRKISSAAPHNSPPPSAPPPVGKDDRSCPRRRRRSPGRTRGRDAPRSGGGRSSPHELESWRRVPTSDLVLSLWTGVPPGDAHRRRIGRRADGLPRWGVVPQLDGVEGATDPISAITARD